MFSLPSQDLRPAVLPRRSGPFSAHHCDLGLPQDVLGAVSVPVGIPVVELVKSVESNVRVLRGTAVSTPGRVLVVPGRVVGVAAGAAAAEKGQGEERAEGVQRAGDDTDALLDDGPQTNLAGAKHELGGVVVESQEAESYDCCATRTDSGVSGFPTSVIGEGGGEERGGKRGEKERERRSIA